MPITTAYKMNIPEEIRLNPEKNTLTLRYADQEFALSAEYLRVYSPSAEVRGHGVGQEVLQTGKRFVQITDLAMTGNYALKIAFSDGHDSGLYDWDYLYRLGENHAANWQNYLHQLDAAGANRDVDRLAPQSKHNEHGGCGGGNCGCKH